VVKVPEKGKMFVYVSGGDGGEREGSSGCKPKEGTRQRAHPRRSSRKKGGPTVQTAIGKSNKKDFSFQVTGEHVLHTKREAKEKKKTVVEFLTAYV